MRTDPQTDPQTKAPGIRVHRHRRDALQQALTLEVEFPQLPDKAKARETLLPPPRYGGAVFAWWTLAGGMAGLMAFGWYVRKAVQVRFTGLPASGD